MKSYRFRPGWLTTLAFLLVLPVLVGLGIWQLDRAAEKEEILNRNIERGQMNPVAAHHQGLDVATMEFRRAVVRGRYFEDGTIFLDNRVLDGVPGYEVLTPLDISGGGDRYILVNRGWVPWGESRRELPDIQTPPYQLELAGRLRAPPEDYFTLESGDENRAFSPLWQNLDLERYRRATGLAVDPLVLELDPSDTSGGGFVRQWPEFGDAWISRHKAYAFQWFALALTLVVLYVVLNTSIRSEATENDSR